jgi:glycerol uptake facilitator-like aquaporin
LSLSRRLAAEAIGTGLLLVAIVGSGIMGDRLSGGNIGLALLANSLATGAALVVLILTFGPISGAHFNPVVTAAEAMAGRLTGMAVVTTYIAAQVGGGVLGVATAHMMFGEPAFVVSQHARAGWAQIFSEGVATFGLLSVIASCARTRAAIVPFAVGAYITGAYWFTSSTSFANPAVTLARALTNTFTGIRPTDVPGFIGAQLAGAALAVACWRWLLPEAAVSAQEHALTL